MLTIRRAAFSSSMALKKGGSTQSAVALGFIVDVLHLACFSGNLPQRYIQMDVNYQADIYTFS